MSDTELDEDLKQPQTSTKSAFSISNPEVLKQLSSVKYRDTPCRPLDLSKKSKCNSPSSSTSSADQPFENGTTTNVKTKSWPVNFVISDRQTSPFVLNQVRPSVIRSAGKQKTKKPKKLLLRLFDGK